MTFFDDFWDFWHFLISFWTRVFMTLLSFLNQTDIISFFSFWKTWKNITCKKRTRLTIQPSYNIEIFTFSEKSRFFMFFAHLKWHKWDRKLETRKWAKIIIFHFCEKRGPKMTQNWKIMIFWHFFVIFICNFIFSCFF